MRIGNPFPAAAVARLTDAPGVSPSIVTPAVQQALGYVDDYLSGAPGNVIAVVGEYGTGKTHLALAILRHVARSGTDFTSLYLDAPADTFLALYQQRFVVELSKADVRDRVEEYYADIVADSLTGSELTNEVAQRLRDREVEAQAVIDRMGLMESAFQQELQQRLHVVTENGAFGTALTLFLRPEFEDAVWEWLKGHPPDQALVERGITGTIDNDTAALEAIGVFAFLFGRQNQRFVLVIDELEKVLSPPHQPGADAVLAFKKLLEVFSGARAFLVLSGLPDFMEALPSDTRQRIGCIVRPSALSAADTGEYIMTAQQRGDRPRTLKPFSLETVAYLVELAGGNARKVIKLCYHSFQSALAAGTDVTQAMIREAAREQFELTTRDDVRAEIARVLDLGGWLFDTDHHVGSSKIRARADFWVPQGDGGSGCAILLTSSVLQEKEALLLADRAGSFARSSEAARGVLVVVNGYLPNQLAAVLAAHLDRAPLIYSTRRFTEDFDAAIKGVMLRLENADREDELKIVRDRIDRLSRQQARTLEDISGTIHNQQESIDLLVRYVERVEAMAKASGAEPRRETEVGAPDREPPSNNFVAHGDMTIVQSHQEEHALPHRLAREFTPAIQAAQAMYAIGRIVSTVLDEGSMVGELGMPRRISTRDALAGIGTAALLETMIKEFRESILRWLRDVELNGPDPERWARLGSICEAFDILYHGLQLRSLKPLREMTVLLPGPEPLDIDTIGETVANLSGRVYDACRKEVEAAEA